jgi:hypothetical protein
LEADYRVELADLKEQTVCFRKNVGKSLNQSNPAVRPKSRLARTATSVNNYFTPIDSTAKTINICGYKFYYLQQLIPECDDNGCIVKYYPQDRYDNKRNLPLLYHGKGAFCRFSIDVDGGAGVYLWVVDNKIIYIGETVDLKKRFNMGYGHIAPRNCYVGGQSTNCKMNKVVLNLYEEGKIVSLYFYQTPDYKQVELELLRAITTLYNIKDN